MSKPVHIHQRINRISGQLKGIDNMITQERECKDILLQINAIKAAINNLGLELAKGELCKVAPGDSQTVNQILTEVSRL